MNSNGGVQYVSGILSCVPSLMRWKTCLLECVKVNRSDTDEYHLTVGMYTKKIDWKYNCGSHLGVQLKFRTGV